MAQIAGVEINILLDNKSVEKRFARKCNYVALKVIMPEL